ncbi:hypothetical protein Sango_3099600 [Sesamum angolense]|uniref:Uncharacterized protein n=1 Tax=Sesamum angolense TaxID=2727404 RepID=A0AAE1TAG3_9LAMI|nr:hypothetical protein Sango_3099600 [Sesamum angolense]
MKSFQGHLARRNKGGDRAAPCARIGDKCMKQISLSMEIWKTISTDRSLGFGHLQESFKQATTAYSTTEAECIADSQAAKEVIWMKNYIQKLGVLPSIAEPVVIFYDNNGAIAQANELRSHHHSKHIVRCYHLGGEPITQLAAGALKRRLGVVLLPRPGAPHQL